MAPEAPPPASGPAGGATDRTISLPPGAAPPPPGPEAAPLPARQDRIGPYEILGPLAHGGMGMVYRARDPKLGREVALKVLLGGAWAGPELQQRFLREAKVLAGLSHPGIVPIHDMGVDGKTPFYSMDLVEGLPLGEHIRSRGLALADRLRLLVQVCDAVQHAHMKGIIHRDLKPANILVKPDGSPVILDFGLAHLTGPAEGEGKGEALTMSGAVMGTPLYMAPEQARGDTSSIDTRTDVYALGVILYELAAGRPPFEQKEPVALLRAVAEEEPRPPSAHRKGIPRDLEHVILKAMAKEPARRYPSADALVEDLRRFLSGRAVGAHPDSTLYRLRKWARRHKELSATLAAATILICLAFWRALEERSQALLERNKAVEAGRRAEAALAEARRRIVADELLAKAFVLSKKNDRSEKIALIREAILLVPSHPHAYFDLGEALKDRKEMAGAADAYRTAIRLNPDLVQAYLGFSDSLRGWRFESPSENAHRLQEAASLLRSLIDRKPTVAGKVIRDLLKLAEAIHRLGFPGEAASCLDGLPESLQIPALDQADVFLQVGSARLDLGRHEEALAAFSRAIETLPLNPKGLLLRARALDLLGRTAEARLDYEKALEIAERFDNAPVREAARKGLESLSPRAGGAPE